MIINSRFVPYLEQKKIQGLFKDTFPIFQGFHSMLKKALSMCLFYPEGLSVLAPCRYLRIRVGQS